MHNQSSNTSEFSADPFKFQALLVRAFFLVLLFPVLLVLAPLILGFVYLNPMFQISRSRLVARKLQWGAIPI